MKKIMAAALVAACVPAAQAAPFVDLEFGGGMTFPSLNDGQVGNDVSLTDSGGEFNLDLEADNGFYLGGRIGLPIVPDVKLRYERLRFENSDFNQTFKAFGETYTAEGEVSLDMSHLDTVLHYGLPDLAPGIDYFVHFGVNLRWMLGGFEAEVENSERESEDFGFPIPAGHLAAGVTLPMADVQLAGELNTLPLSGLSHNDWNIRARWFPPLPLDWAAKVGLEAGYRSWTIDIDGSEAGLIDDDDFVLEFDTSGFFVGTAVTF